MPDYFYEVVLEDIQSFRTLFKLTDKDGPQTFNVRFENKVVKVFPIVRKDIRYMQNFVYLVVAHEFLLFHHKQKKDFSDDQIIDAFNSVERERVESLVKTYLSMSRSEFEKAVETKFVALGILKGCILVPLILGTLIFILIMILIFTSGEYTIAGILGFVALIIVLAGYAFRGTRGPNFWRRKY